ncbi:MAG: hypothetical protein PHO37_16145, partial [Kiritimatiellae bacterium]|nr:hypothetical protein [Kiritimatiellia bacterium]
IPGRLRLALRSTVALPARSRPAALQLRPDNRPAGAFLTADGLHCAPLSLCRRVHGPPPYSFGLTIARLARPWPLAACKTLGWRVSCTSRSTVAAGRDRGGALMVNRLTADGSHCAPLSLCRRGHGQPPYSFGLPADRLTHACQVRSKEVSRYAADYTAWLSVRVSPAVARIADDFLLALYSA